MFNKLLTLLGLHKDVGAPVHVGANPVYFTYVFDGAAGWTFSWHSADHKQGEINTYWSEHDAETARTQWERKKKVYLPCNIREAVNG